MERPDIDALYEAEKDRFGSDASNNFADDVRNLIAYIRYLESKLSNDGEPYIIKAGEFNAEKHERQSPTVIYNEWTGEPLVTFAPDKPIIVRDKPTQIGRTERGNHDT